MKKVFLMTFLNQEGFCYFHDILIYLLSPKDMGSNTMCHLHDMNSNNYLCYLNDLIH